jgi:hypothetical protein
MNKLNAKTENKYDIFRSIVSILPIILFIFVIGCINLKISVLDDSIKERISEQNDFIKINSDETLEIQPSIKATTSSSAQDSTAQLMADVIKSEGENKPEIKRDIGALLAWLKARNPDDTNYLIEATNQKLSDNPQALDFFEAIKQDLDQSNSEAAFGPVDASQPLAAERLALLARITRLLSLTRVNDFYKGINDFVSRSGGATPQSFRVSKQVQELLGQSAYDGGRWWRDEIVPVLLQYEWENTDFVAAASGKDLPGEWMEAENWLKPWVAERQLKLKTSILTPNDGFLNSANSGGRPVATHPLVLRILRERILNNLGNSNTQEVLKWMSTQLSTSPEAAFSIGSIILEASNRQHVTINSKGEINGKAPWADLTREVIQSIVVNSDAGNEILASWQGKHPRLDELYRLSPKWQEAVLGDANGNEVLKRYGLFRFINEWKELNAESSVRYESIPNLTNETLKSAVEDAKLMQAKLTGLMGNPFCAPWLTLVLLNDPPRSLESGILIRWYSSRLKPRDLEIALEKQWSQVAGNLDANPAAKDSDKLIFIDYFSAWETARGEWTGKTPTGDAEKHPLSPWGEITTEDLVNNKWKPIEQWLNDPKVFPKNNPAFIESLTAFSWLGVPDNFSERRQQIQKALLDSKSGSDLEDSDKLFLDAVRINFVVTSILSGERIVNSFDDSALLGADELNNLPSLIEKFYKDGRPYVVRAGVDLSALLAHRALSIKLMNSTTSSHFEQSPSSAPNSFDRSDELRKLAKQNLEKLNGLMEQSIQAVRDKRRQSGLALALTQLELDLLKSLRVTNLTVNQKKRSDSFKEWNTNALTIHALGTSFWGMDAWLNVWQSDIQSLSEKRLLTIDSLPYKKSQNAQRRYIGALAAMISGEISPTPDNNEYWSNPEQWRIFISRKDEGDPAKKPGSNIQISTVSSQLGDLITNIPISSLPWTNNARPEGTLIPILDRAAALQGLTRETTVDSVASKSKETVDIDGLNENYLPSRSWAALSNDLNNQIQQLKELENSISDKYNNVKTWEAVNSLKPLLAAPLVVNLSSFRNELAVAIADVRRAESLLGARKQESLAAEMELMAQQLLTNVHKLETERTRLLLAIQENEKTRAAKERQIKEKEEAIAKKIEEKGEQDAEVTKLKEQKAELERQRKTIDVGIAARAVETVKNEVAVIEDLVITPKPHPADNTKSLSGQLGVLAYNAELKVKKQIDDLNGRKETLKHQLSDLREASLIKGVLTFIGAVVGAIIGGPAGAQIGAMIGDAVGGVIVGIKQGKPFLEILESTLQNGFKIAAEAGVDLKGEFNKLGPEGSEVGKLLENARNVIGPILKELPTYLDKKILEDSLSVPGVGKSLKDVLIQVKNQSLANLTAEIPVNLESPFLKGMQNVLLKGTPEEIQRKLRDQAHAALINISIDDELKKAARELKIEDIEKLTDEQLREKMADQIALLEIIRIVPKMNDKRNQTISRLMISLTALQAVLKNGDFDNLENALNSAEFRNSLKDLKPEEFSEQFELLKKFLEGVQIKQKQEIIWGELEAKLRDAVIQLFPNDVRRQEFILGRLQIQLNSEGMRAEIEKLLNPWNLALQKRMERVEDKLKETPVTEDQEERIEWQFNQLTEAQQILNTEVLSWLKNENGTSEENRSLGNELNNKRSKLRNAEDELKKTDIDLQKALLEIAEAGFIKKQAALDLQIGTLQSSASTLAVQQAELTLKNIDIETQRVSLQEEQMVLQELISNNRAEALNKRKEAALKESDAAQAEYEMALARMQAVRNRAVVYGRIEGWYANAQLPDNSQTIVELNNLADEHQRLVADTGRTIREMLRIIRFANGNSAGFELPTFTQTWGRYLETKVSPELSQRYAATGLPNVETFGYDLLPKQIDALFSETGLQFTITHRDPVLINEKNYKADAERGAYYVKPSRNENVFRIYLMAEDENKDFINQNWDRDPVQHGTSAPILEKISFGNYMEKNMIWTEPVLQTLRPWEAKINAQPNTKISQNEIYDIIKKDFTVTELSKAVTSSEFMEQRRMPLTGTYYFRVRGNKPYRARIVLVYSSQQN